MAVKKRFVAAVVHSLICCIVFIVVLALVKLGWYPGSLFKAMDVGRVMVLLLVVDVCIGPLLTFVVFKPEKASLQFDLTVIALLQMAGLIYGLHALYQGRPAWLVFVQDRFEVTRLADVDAKHLQGLQLPTSWVSPVWASVPLLTDEQKSDFFTQVTRGEADVAQRPNLFQSLASNWSAVQSKALALEELNKVNAADAVQRVLHEHPDAKRWLPLQATEASLVVLLGDSPDQVHLVDLNGWALTAARH